jgi:uncharacterized protein
VSTAFERLGGERFISLTTFRRSGEPVSTPVWVVLNKSALLVTTQLSTGKIKRLRHTSRVSCGRAIGSAGSLMALPPSPGSPKSERMSSRSVS